MNMSELVKDRNEAFVEAVVNDNWDKLRKYSKKYGIPIPRKRAAMKAAVYKAVQYCKDIPEEIKLQAMQKCLEMGLNPYIEECGIPELQKGEAK